MRIVAPLLILLCLAGCALPATLGSGGDPGVGVWPDQQVARDVAAIRAGMEQARADADGIAARREP